MESVLQSRISSHCFGSGFAHTGAPPPSSLRAPHTARAVSAGGGMAPGKRLRALHHRGSLIFSFMNGMMDECLMNDDDDNDDDNDE